MSAHLKIGKRKRKDTIFKLACKFSVLICLTFLVMIIFSITKNGYSAFFTHQINLEVEFDRSKPYFTELVKEYNELEDKSSMTLDEYLIENVSYGDVLKDQTYSSIVNSAEYDAVTTTLATQDANLVRQEIEKLSKFISISARVDLQNLLKKQGFSDQGEKYKLSFLVNGKLDSFLKRRTTRLGDVNTDLVSALKKIGMIEVITNKNFFGNSDSRHPELAGILGSTIGSLMIIFIFLVIACPIGILTGLYLEEFAKRNALNTMLEVVINNLSGVPSIIYGLLGLFVYINNLGFPRSSAIVGGLTVSLLAIPTVIIATRTAISGVPQYIKDGAIAMGASRLQVAIFHTIPMAIPGILTGCILAMLRVIGETAPLMMIGMVAFIVSPPTDFASPSTTLPVQIFLWSDSVEFAFVEKTSAAIMVLLVILFTINFVTLLIRNRFETKL